VPIFGVNSSFAGYIGSRIDVTDQKLAEEALSKVSQKLIEAHEEERARLARELHDDVVQRLALLAVSLAEIKKNLPKSAIELHRGMEGAHHAAAELGNDVQSLSHQLHPSKLEILGLAKATTSFCKELSERQGMKIDVHAESVPQDLPKDISLCLFRVLQEALHNAAKHSGARHFEVSLIGSPSGIELTVHDSGIGIDPAEALKGDGLGLKSMSERLKLVSGELFVLSRVGEGTTIRAVVPLRNKIACAGLPQTRS
jgi:signal transduction histidine kinase